jgi:long-chain fatty acid transport protein
MNGAHRSYIFPEEDDMSGMKRNMVLALAVAAAVAAPSAFATNGYFTEGEGTVNRGMAGAGIAMPQDALAAAVNPAGLVKLGGRWDVGLGVFRPDRKYEISGNFAGLNNSANGNEDGNFWIPSFGYNMKLSSTDAFNISVYGNGGMNTNYNKAVFGSFGSTGNTGVDLSQLFVNGAYAHSFGAMSVGGSAIFAYQRFKAYGLQAFDSATYSSSPGNVTNNGYDTTNGFGVRLGALYDIDKDVSVGATYQSKIKGTFDKYKGLFADQGEFNIPSTYGVGIAWKATPAVDVALDYTKIKYTDSQSVSNPLENLYVLGLGGTKKFGDSGGPGFGWKDISVIKLGIQYKPGGDWTWRGGWNHGQNPIPNSQAVVNILAPGVIEDHLNLGFTKAMDKNSDINFMYMHAFNKKVSGAIPTAFGGGTAEIQMFENYAEIGYSKKF